MELEFQIKVAASIVLWLPNTHAYSYNIVAVFSVHTLEGNRHSCQKIFKCTRTCSKTFANSSHTGGGFA